MKMLAGALAAALLLTANSACGGGSDGGGAATPVIDPGDGGNYKPNIDPADFVARIDNPYLPLTPGARWVYESEDGERVEVVVLAETRQILGITATVVRDTVTEDGEIVEDTFDWFAQDRDGNVWYLGEDSKEFKDGKPINTAGSWEAGKDGAQPGIVMRASPQPGASYRQEFYRGEAEDMAMVLRLDGAETVPFGQFSGLLVRRDWTPLEPKAIEDKYYARGVGLVLEAKVGGGGARLELVSFDAGK
jgi:hypothetical protein